MLQSDGASALYVASQKGRVECVRALLGGGAAINQANVSCAGLTARHRGDASVCRWLGAPLVGFAVQHRDNGRVNAVVQLSMRA